MKLLTSPIQKVCLEVSLGHLKSLRKVYLFILEHGKIKQIGCFKKISTGYRQILNR